MMDYFNGLWVVISLSIRGFVEDLKDDERGVAGIVAAVILVLIAVLLAALFWGKIQEFFNSTWERITQGTDQIQ